MSFIYYNPNPEHKDDIDCVVRAISKIENISWEDAYLGICTQGYFMHLIPIRNKVWSTYLLNHGYHYYDILDTCPDCYTVRDFCLDHPKGRYLLAVLVNYIDQFQAMDSGKHLSGNHVVTVINGNYYDAWDSGGEVPIAYWTK